MILDMELNHLTNYETSNDQMDLVQKHPFTKALLELGLGLQTEDTAKKTLRKGTGKNISILLFYGKVSSTHLELINVSSFKSD